MVVVCVDDPEALPEHGDDGDTGVQNLLAVLDSLWISWLYVFGCATVVGTGASEAEALAPEMIKPIVASNAASRTA